MGASQEVCKQPLPLEEWSVGNGAVECVARKNTTG